MAEFSPMSLTSRNSVLKILGADGAMLLLNAVAELGGVKSNHSMLSHGDSENVMPSPWPSVGTGETLVAMEDRGVSIMSLLLSNLSSW